MQVQLKNLTKTYSDADRELTVLSDLTMDFPIGQSIAILGKSGVGKSTLLHVLGGLDEATSGDVLIGEQSLGALSNEALSKFRGRNIGFVFQFHHLLGEFSALENVAMPLLIAGVGEEEAESRAADVLREMGLESRMSHRPSALSGGEQQRVAISRAVVSRPPVVLADEPTGNLDSKTAHEVTEFLLKIVAESSATLIVVTHSIDFSRKMDVVYEMIPGGKLVVSKVGREDEESAGLKA